MKFFWRLVLLSLLTLALPLQGLAAGLHGHGLAGGAEAAADGMLHPDQGEITSPCHEPESPECSVCAACCLAAALPGSVLAWRAAAPADAPQAAVSSAPRPALTTRLERPPRTTSL